MFVQHRRGIQVIDRHVEKTLNLCGVQIHRQHPIGAGARDDVGHQLRGDRHPAGVFAILPGIAEIRQHRRNAVSAGPQEAVDHDQQLHQIFVHRRASRLHDKHIAAADVFIDFAGNFAVGKIADRDFPQRQAQIFANLRRPEPDSLGR